MQKNLVFVSTIKGTSKGGRDYDLVSLSNGLRTGTLGNENHLDFSKYKEGDEIVVKFDLSLNYKNEFVLVPVSVEKAK